MENLDHLAADWGATPWDGPLDDGGVGYVLEGPEAIGILTVQVRTSGPPHRAMVFLSMRYPQVEEVLDAWYATSQDRPVATWRVSVSRWAGDVVDLDVPVWLDDPDDTTVLEPTVAAGFAWLAARVASAGDTADIIDTMQLDRHRSWQSEAVALRLAGRSDEATALVGSMVAEADAGTARRHARRVHEFAEWFATAGTGSSSPPRDTTGS